MFSDDPRIKPYEFRGLHGRYIYIPSKDKNSKRTFLTVYGQHATIERCIALLEALAHFGDVYLVDTPGFGGMEPSYKIKEYPSLDFYADHIKNIFDTVLPANQPITLLGISFGWEIITTFLDKNAAYFPRITEAISFVGFMTYKDFEVALWLEYLLKFVSITAKTWVGSKIYRYTFFQDFILKPFYLYYSKKTPRFIGVDPSEVRRHAAEQSWLWRINDIRTHGATSWDYLMNNDLASLKIAMPIIHLGVPHDHYLDNKKIVAEMQAVFKSVMVYELQLASHAPVAFESPEEILAFIPTELQTYLLADLVESKVD